MSPLPRVLLIAGPTAVGKSSLAHAVAKRLGAEILSIDSVQLYRGLDIGSAKASAQERAEVPYHLVDVLDPDETNNVAEFVELAMDAVRAIAAKGRPIIAVGGTNLYVRVFVHGIFDAPPPNPEIRRRHHERARAKGSPALHAELARIDPELAARIGENDLVRISRGLEVHEATGKRLSELQAEHAFATPNVDALKIALNRPRAELYDRIDRRVDAMMDRGLYEEYVELAARHPEIPRSLESLGYRHMGWIHTGAMSRDEAVALLGRDTRRFAKQQISWLRSEPGVHWAPADADVERIVADAALFFEGGDPPLDWVDPSAARW